jgi:spore coat polysaccharide biosynthesis predicted glycosyltransferase SpsG
LADINISPILGLLTPPPGSKALCGKEYILFGREIKNARRIRTTIKSIVVSMGGSDTHGLTVHVVRELKKMGIGATVVLGPLASAQGELQAEIDARFCVKRAVPSLAEEFLLHDLAITNGGLTPFQANAAGLPCIVVATEPHEVTMGKYLDGLGASVFAGFREKVDIPLTLGKITSIEQMSKKGINTFDFDAAERIYKEIKCLEKDSCHSST